MVFCQLILYFDLHLFTGPSASSSAHCDGEEILHCDGHTLFSFKNIWVNKLPFADIIKLEDVAEAYVTEFDKRPKASNFINIIKAL